MTLSADHAEVTIALEGGRKARGKLTRSRIRVVIVAILLAFAVIGGRLVGAGLLWLVGRRTGGAEGGSRSGLARWLK